MGATDSGCTNLIYNLVPEPVRDPPYPERSLADCSFPMLTEFDNGILACGGGGSRECHHLPWGGQVWQPHSTMINSHTRGQAVVIQGKVWVSGSRLATELYDGSQWVAGPNLPFSCSDHRMIVISSQEVSPRLRSKVKCHGSLSFAMDRSCFSEAMTPPQRGECGSIPSKRASGELCQTCPP